MHGVAFQRFSYSSVALASHIAHWFITPKKRGRGSESETAKEKLIQVFLIMCITIHLHGLNTISEHTWGSRGKVIRTLTQRNFLKRANIHIHIMYLWNSVEFRETVSLC